MMTAEVQQLIERAKENIRAVSVLQREQFPEIAASRGYYAMFYAAEAALLTHTGQSFSSHAALIAAFGREFAKTQLLPVQLHRYLIDAYEMRQSSDYDFSSSVTPEEVQQTYAHAEEFVREVIKFLAE
jgi:uncharacterized protein (UPF0332 family)